MVGKLGEGYKVSVGRRRDQILRHVQKEVD